MSGALRIGRVQKVRGSDLPLVISSCSTRVFDFGGSLLGSLGLPDHGLREADQGAVLSSTCLPEPRRCQVGSPSYSSNGAFISKSTVDTAL